MTGSSAPAIADTPATIPVAVTALVNAGVLLATRIFGWDGELSTLVMGFSLAATNLALLIFLNRTTTTTAAPVVPKGTEVAIEGSTHTVTAEIPPQVDPA